MKTKILEGKHFIGKKILKIRDPMSKDELLEHVNHIRLTRMFITRIPFYFTEDLLTRYFS
jgi:hypothetical protein